jgi:hypothetical protein
MQTRALNEHMNRKGIPPNIKINKNTIIIPAIITGIRNRRIASATIAMSTTMSRVIIDPLYDSILVDPITD